MKVKVSNVTFSQTPELVNTLLKEFPDAEFNYEGKRFTEKELVSYFMGAEAVIVGLEQITSTLLDQLPELKIVAKYGVGLDNVDINACEERGITIGWTGGVNNRSVAEMALGFMLGLSRNLMLTSAQLKKKIWNKNGGTQLTGKTIGIIGLGNIGKDLVSLLKPFGCRILVNDLVDVSVFSAEYGLVITDKETIYKEADIITIHVPFNKTTENMINAQAFKLMKPCAQVINTARGGIVNEDDLFEAITKGKIAGAALDVYVVEPPYESKLLTLESIITTPHVGGNSHEAVIAMGLSAVNHLINYKSKKEHAKA
jgi:phosphoglycerate dehydrogenase-like enzyme